MQQIISYSTKVLKILKTHPFVTLLYLTTLILSYLFFAIFLYISFYFRTFAGESVKLQ